MAVKVAASLIVATGILIWAVIEDLRSRKFSNRSFVAASVIAVLTVVASSLAARLSGGAGGEAASLFISATLGFGSGIVFFLPLVLIGVVGAGDMKLMAAVGILIGWHAVLWTGVYGLVWGAIFGVVQIIARRQLGLLRDNLTNLAITRSKGNLQLHHIPFTAPLLLGWLSHLVLSGAFR